MNRFVLLFLVLAAACVWLFVEFTSVWLLFAISTFVGFAWKVSTPPPDPIFVGEWRVSYKCRACLRPIHAHIYRTAHCCPYCGLLGASSGLRVHKEAFRNRRDVLGGPVIREHES